MPAVVRRLRRAGARVDVIVAEEGVRDLGAVRAEHDLYVLKSGSEAALSLAGALDAAGARILNPYGISAACRDKVVTTRVLQQARVPVPESYVAARLEDLAPALADGPLVVKPNRGSQGRGVRVVSTVEELGAGAADDGPVFAQRHQAPDGLDRKLYCIGDDVFGVERVWPARTYEDKLGRPLEVTDELRDIARRCAAGFGLSVFGFDVVVSDGRPYVVDLSSFPGFKGVPEADRLLADHILGVARGAVALGRRAIPAVAA
jgi:ribosomal protein S6--L-glutamate ligase